MLTLYTGAGAVPLQIDDYYVKELASGLDELCFSVSIWDDAYPLIQEESSIREESPDGAASYLVKAAAVCEKTGDKAKALSFYKKVKDQYPQAPEAMDIDKYITRIELAK